MGYISYNFRFFLSKSAWPNSPFLSFLNTCLIAYYLRSFSQSRTSFEYTRADYFRLKNGVTYKTSSEKHGVTENVIGKWRKRFASDGLEGLAGAPRSGKPA